MTDTARVQGLLSDLRGAPVSVTAVENLATGRGSVARLQLSAAWDGGASSIIAKQRALGEWSQVNLDSERAALIALHGTDLAPRLILHDKTVGMLVMTDVGTRTIEQTLLHGTADEATTQLTALARTIAALHQVAITPDQLSTESTWTIGTHAIDWPLLLRAVDELDLPEAGHAQRDVDALLAELTHPADHHVFCHGDATPNNAVIGADGRCRLVDFEGATLQHFGTDASMLRFPFAWYGRWALLPSDVQQQMEQAYRQGSDRPDHDRGIAVGCAAMALLRLQRLPVIADPTQPSESAVRRRVQIVSTVDVAAAAMEDAQVFPLLATWLRNMSDAICSRWEEARLPARLYPAFL